MFSKKRVLPFKSYFYFLPRLFSFVDSKFFLFHFNAHKSNYINERVKAKLAFSSSKHNFLTTPPSSCLFTIIHLCRSSSIFYSTSFPEFSPTHLYEASERERDPGWVWSRMPRAKLILREEFFVSQFFVFFSFCHHTIDPSFRFHRLQ